MKIPTHIDRRISMGSKFKELIEEYGKVKQFPLDADLMPLSKQPKTVKKVPPRVDPVEGILSPLTPAEEANDEKP